MIFKKLGYLLVFLFASWQASAFSTKAQYAILVDATTGATLYEKNAYERMTPSSMGKLMTLYLVFDRLKNGSMKLYDNMLVTPNAWRMNGSKTFLSPNTMVSVENLLRGVIVQSGNDASVVFAESISGSERDFTDLMNSKALELGLKNSHFANATGLPNRDHYMSAADIACLSARLIQDFPEYYHYFSEKEFVFNNIKQRNRNALLHTNGVDGLKTGHTDAGGYGISTSAFKDGRRLIAVVNGLHNEKERNVEAQKLLQYGFLNFNNVTIAKKNSALGEIPVFLGKVKNIEFGTKKNIIFTITIVNKGKTKVTIKHTSVLYAPVDRAKKVGEIIVQLYDGKTYNFSLHPLEGIRKLGFFGKISAKIKTWVSNFSFKDPKENEKEQIIMV